MSYLHLNKLGQSISVGSLRGERHGVKRVRLGAEDVFWQAVLLLVRPCWPGWRDWGHKMESCFTLSLLKKCHTIANCFLQTPGTLLVFPSCPHPASNRLPWHSPTLNSLIKLLCKLHSGCFGACSPSSLPDITQPDIKVPNNDVLCLSWPEGPEGWWTWWSCLAPWPLPPLPPPCFSKHVWASPRGGGELKPLISEGGPTLKEGGFFSSARGSKSSSSLSVEADPLRPLVVGADGSSARGLKSSSSLLTPFEMMGLVELGRMSLKRKEQMYILCNPYLFIYSLLTYWPITAVGSTQPEVFINITKHAKGQCLTLF